MVMRTVAVISQKGGVGKTTLATALAVAAEQSGRSAAVVDLDPQASAAFWKDTRSAETPAVVAIPSARLGHVLRTAGESGCELAIVDAPPFAKDIAFEAAQHADFILIPTRPAVLDVMAMTRTLELVRPYEKPAAVVLTFCPPQGRELSDTEDAVRRLGAEPMAARLDPGRVGAAHQSLHHFVAKAAWDDAALLRAVRDHALPALLERGPVRAWLVDDTGLPKKGKLSVGVARQYCGQLGKRDNCQVAVTLSVATERASLPVAYRLYLPEAWADDPVRRALAGRPEEGGV